MSIHNKRSFQSFEDSTKSSTFDNPKKRQRKNKQRKKNPNNDYFRIAFRQPLSLLKSDTDGNIEMFGHCLILKNILPFMHESHLYFLIKSALKDWYATKEIKKQKSKGVNEVLTNGAIDIHLFHNRQNTQQKAGFAYITFENKSDANFILQLSDERKLKMNNHLLSADWKTSATNTDSYSIQYQTDIHLKDETCFIFVSNLHWKSTLLHIWNIFKSLNEISSILFDSNDNNSETETNIDCEPLWLKILEDKNGYPKNCALVLLKNAKSVTFAINHLNGSSTINARDGTFLLGRRLTFKYSKFKPEEDQTIFNFHFFDANQQLLKGESDRLYIKNIKHSCKTADIYKFIAEHMHGLIPIDIHLFHNLQKICSGHCIIQFESCKQATKAMKALHLQRLNYRSIIAEYAKIEIKKNENGSGRHLRGKTNRLFISNLVWDIKEKDIYRFFSNKKIFSLLNVFIYVHATGFPKGFAFLNFETNEMASNALDYCKNKKLRNRKIMVDFAQARNNNRFNSSGDYY